MPSEDFVIGIRWIPKTKENKSKYCHRIFSKQTGQKFYPVFLSSDSNICLRLRDFLEHFFLVRKKKFNILSLFGVDSPGQAGPQLCFYFLISGFLRFVILKDYTRAS